MILKHYLKSIGFLDRRKSVKKAARKETILHRASYLFAKKHGGPILHEFIEKTGTDKDWMFDVRVHYLSEGQLPAIDAFHLDYFSEENAGSKAIIAVVGGCSLTEFISTDVKVDADRPTTPISPDIPLAPHQKRQIQNYEIVEYNNSTFHRATPAVKDGWRILIRAVYAAGVAVPHDIILDHARIWRKGNAGNPDLKVWIQEDGSPGISPIFDYRF